jgi:transporter family protein
LKNLVVLSLIVTLQVIGNVLLSRGMRTIGAMDQVSAGALLDWSIKIVTNPYVVIGVGLLILWFLIYLGALSWLDLSYVLPMSSSTYVFSALLAWLVLGESVSKGTWAGTVIVSVGVLLVGQSERVKTGPNGDGPVELAQSSEERVAR